MYSLFSLSKLLNLVSFSLGRFDDLGIKFLLLSRNLLFLDRNLLLSLNDLGRCFN